MHFGGHLLEVNDRQGRRGKICCLSEATFEYTPDSDSFFRRDWHKYGKLPPKGRDPVYPTLDSQDYYSGGHRRLIDEHQMNFDVVGAWLLACETSHARCHLSSLAGHKRRMSLTFVDVVERRLVDAPSSEKYVALSYVWGDTKPFKATMRNISRLKALGSLKTGNGEIPLVLTDAMDMVEKIGQRFLWIDSICIIQDDPISKQQVFRMDQIYAGAVFTIIALSAAHANEGLAGVRPGTRLVTSRVGEIHGRQLVTAFPEVWDVFNSSVYATRGWTFQEHMLSPRRLYVTEHQAYWECAQEVWAEDTVGGLHSNSMLDPIKDLLNRGQADLTRWFGFYEFLVQQYTSRTLKFSNDIFEAFAGIASRLESWCDQKIAAGIPLGSLLRALFFAPADGLPAPRRRQLPDRNFPSWSWLAWEGRITYGFTHLAKGGDMFVLKSLVKGVRLGVLGSPDFFPIAPHDPPGTFHGNDSDGCETERWALDNISLQTVPTVEALERTIAGDPPGIRGGWDAEAYFKLQTPICLSFIARSVSSDQFAISAARFTQDTPEGAKLHLASISDSSGSNCGIICAPPAQAELGEASKCQQVRLVGISFGIKSHQIRGLPRTDREGSTLFKDGRLGEGEDLWCGCLVDVMLISRNTKTNLSQRLAVGKMHSDIWWKMGSSCERIFLV